MAKAKVAQLREIWESDLDVDQLGLLISNSRARFTVCPSNSEADPWHRNARGIGEPNGPLPHAGHTFTAWASGP